MLYLANSQLHKLLDVWSYIKDLVNIKLIVWPSYNNFNALLNCFTAILGKDKIEDNMLWNSEKKNNNNKKGDKNKQTNKQINEKNPQKRNTTNTVEQAQRKEEPQNWENVSFVVGKRGP